jgi:hypothetical protein
MNYLILLVIVVIWIYFKTDRNKKCAWCNARKIKFKIGKEGSWFWEYRNKDGSRDKRVKGNFQQAKYTSQYICKLCNGETIFSHLISPKPSKKVKVCTRSLLNEGSGERKGSDWEQTRGVVTINANTENRKSK